MSERAERETAGAVEATAREELAAILERPARLGAVELRNRPRRIVHRRVRANYPATVAEILDDGMKFNRAALAAVRAFRKSKPWRGTIEERMGKFRKLHKALVKAYNIVAPVLRFSGVEEEAAMGNGSFDTGSNTITLYSKLSVTTYLHEFRHALGGDERQATKWSVNLFRKAFPKSFERAQQQQHMLISRRPRRARRGERVYW